MNSQISLRKKSRKPGTNDIIPGHHRLEQAVAIPDQCAEQQQVDAKRDDDVDAHTWLVEQAGAQRAQCLQADGNVTEHSEI